MLTQLDQRVHKIPIFLHLFVVKLEVVAADAEQFHGGLQLEVGGRQIFRRMLEDVRRALPTQTPAAVFLSAPAAAGW